MDFQRPLQVNDVPLWDAESREGIFFLPTAAPLGAFARLFGQGDRGRRPLNSDLWGRAVRWELSLPS